MYYVNQMNLFDFCIKTSDTPIHYGILTMFSQVLFVIRWNKAMTGKYTRGDWRYKLQMEIRSEKGVIREWWWSIIFSVKFKLNSILFYPIDVCFHLHFQSEVLFSNSCFSIERTPFSASHKIFIHFRCFFFLPATQLFGYGFGLNVEWPEVNAATIYSTTNIYLHCITFGVSISV